MEDHCIYEYPATLDLIINDTQKMGFDMASEPKIGSLLRALALMQEIESNPNLTSSRMAWASGLMLVTKTC